MAGYALDKRDHAWRRPEGIEQIVGGVYALVKKIIFLAGDSYYFVVLVLMIP
ncbi:MAG: hypothetical protein K6C05_01495 [Anaerovibrio sp.]|nr:hypothetical protein [Anaerovibrio sp.]